MSSGTTNIDDLPSGNNINMEVKDQPAQMQQEQIQQGQMQQEQPQNTNIPQLSQDDLNKIITGIQQASSNNMTSLPSRDIPQDQTQITQDQQIQPNYVPQNNNQYIVQDMSLEEMVEKNREEQLKKNKKEQMIDEYQTPILIILLFFLFQLPAVNKALFKYMPSLFLKDGNMNFIGFVAKSLAFGLLYYSLTKVIKYVE